MKQKVVIKVSMNGSKSRSKALKIAVGVSGVESAGLGGQDKSQIEVTGDGVDAVALTNLLRKNVGYADLVSVSAVGEEEEKKIVEATTQAQPMVWSYGGAMPQYVYAYSEPPPCSIL